MAWQTPKTNWASADVPAPSDFNRIEGNTAQLRTDLDAHAAATTGVHGATSTATPNTIVQRDSAGRFKAAAPAAADDVARKAEVDAHASRTDNPHAVTKAQVGLGSVQNYGVASQAQAEAGTANDVYMTPLRTAQAIAAKTGGIQFRINNGVLEFNDGGTWRKIGIFKILTPNPTGSKEFSPGDPEALVFKYVGPCRIRRLSVTISSNVGNWSLGIMLRADGNSVFSDTRPPGTTYYLQGPSWNFSTAIADIDIPISSSFEVSGWYPAGGITSSTITVTAILEVPA